MTICDAGCTITAPADKWLNLTFETWGAGGGGGAGGASTSGGGAGGGGGYTKLATTVQTLTSGPLVYQVIVGAGGNGGALYGSLSNPLIYEATDGRASEVRRNGGSWVGATGGKLGKAGGFSSVGGAGGAAFPGYSGNNPYVGLAGGNGAQPNTCNGGAGGAGGVGAGPGAVNNGGPGGHGGYCNNAFNPTCTARSDGWGRTAGSNGANGRVTITWPW